MTIQTDSTTRNITERPVMIIGAPRSGTTWLQKMMLCHEGVCGGQESHFFEYFVPMFDLYEQHCKSPRGVGLPGYLTRRELDELVRQMWMRVMEPIARSKPGAGVLLDKSPNHANYVERIVKVLPGARFILMVRDSRAVVASQLAAGRDGWGRRWAPTSAKSAAKRWRNLYVNAIAALKQLPADQWMMCKYEELTHDAPAKLMQVMRFAGLQITDSQAKQIATRCSGAGSELAGQLNFAMGGEHRNRQGLCEPEGFVRGGPADKWKTELSWWQKHTIWKVTQGAMRELGYNR